MQLTFESGNFILKGRFKDKSEILDLKKAVNFVGVADPTARKVIKRAEPKFYDVPDLPPLSFLDPHQRRGIQWILSRSRSYLAHAPGAGKTCTTICASSLITSSGQVLFLVPPTLTLNWVREVNRFCALMGYYPSVSTVPITENQNNMKWKSDFIICPDSMVTKPWVYENLKKLKLKFLAVDEASRFKDPFSQRSKAFYGGKHNDTVYSGLFQNVPYVVFLDGSALLNRFSEIWAPTYALSPSSIDYDNYFDFGFKYCDPKKNYMGEWEFKGSTNGAQLREKLRKNFMHVVTEEELTHPERLRSIVYVTDKIEHSSKAWERIHFIKKFDEGLSQGALAQDRLAIGRGKSGWVARYVREKLEKNESILLFAWHREVCEILATNLQKYKPAIIYGGTKNVVREKAFREFNSGKTKLLIGNIQSLGRGHNLQRASRVIFAEYSWTDELNKQCEKRSSRRGNKRASIRCEYVVVPDSIDEIILRSVYKKEKAIKQVIG